MRYKILMIAATLAVVLAMTGIAAADQMNIFDGNVKVTAISLPVGGSKDLTINVSEFLNAAGTIHNMSVKLFTGDGAAETTGLDVTLQETVVPLGPVPGANTCDFSAGGCNPLIRWRQSEGVGGSEVLKLKITDSAGVAAKYIVEIEDRRTGQVLVLSSATLGVSVPEFATLALPITAVMGLVFLLYRRKTKEE